LVNSVWCSGGFLYLNGQLFFKFWEMYYISLWFTPLLLQCPWFSGFVFWWNHWVLAYSFLNSWVV
jgi:hypothetical protein